jgi:hypothetical protein
MKRIRAFGHFWYDFVVGDDWRLAVAGGSALAITGLLAHNGVNAWWCTPVIVVLVLLTAVARTTPMRR